MEPEQMYKQVHPVREIADAYAAITPWGGMVHWQGNQRSAVALDDAGLMVRALILRGRAVGNATTGGRTAEIAVEHHGFGDTSGTSVLAPLSGNADSYVRFLPRMDHPAVQQYMPILSQTFEMQLSLPLWMLNARELATADVVPVKTALLHFRMNCEQYRLDLARAVEDVFGGRAEWSEPLESREHLVEYAPMYRAFCEVLGIELVPLKREAQKIADLLSKSDLLPASVVQSIANAYSGDCRRVS